MTATRPSPRCSVPLPLEALSTGVECGHSLTLSWKPNRVRGTSSRFVAMTALLTSSLCVSASVECRCKDTLVEEFGSHSGDI